MILGVNGLRLTGNRSGVARCIEAVLRSMGEMDHPFSKVRVYAPKPLDARVALPRCAEAVVLPSELPPALWEQFTLPAAHGDKDLLFCPSYVIPLLARCPTFVVHHGSYEGYPQAFGWWALNKARMAYSLSAKRATAVSTVSEHSRKDMARFYGVDARKIHVIPEGVDVRLFRPIRDHDRLSQWRVRTFGSDVPYIVYVGKPTERRNLTPLIRAFAGLKRTPGIPHKLLIVGASLPGNSPFRQVIEREGMAQEVAVLGYAEYEDMPLIYNAADAFVYPSSYEGFGMPVLEAMACGTPVIALNNTAFPEFAGGVARLLETAEVEELRRGIETVLTDRGLREHMAKEGPRRAARYDWRIVTRRYLEVMAPLAESKRAA